MDSKLSHDMMVPRDLIIATKMHAQCLSCLKTGELCVVQPQSTVHSGSLRAVSLWACSSSIFKVFTSSEAGKRRSESSKWRKAVKEKVGETQEECGQCSAPPVFSCSIQQLAAQASFNQTAERNQKEERTVRARWRRPGQRRHHRRRKDRKQSGKTHKCRALMLSSTRWHYTHTDDSINLWQSLQLVFRLRWKKASNIYCWQNLFIENTTALF